MKNKYYKVGDEVTVMIDDVPVKAEVVKGNIIGGGEQVLRVILDSGKKICTNNWACVK